MKNLVVLSGAGISAESGITTFRDSGGLWEQYDVMEVASIEGWYQNPELILRFYNERRQQLEHAQPNAAHTVLVELEKHFRVTIVTQNIDNLHERAGSSSVLHLHGELTKACSTREKGFVTDIGYKDIQLNDRAADGEQLRPFIVWFGEAVPMMDKAVEAVASADVLVVVGTSLQVYPAAGLVDYARQGVPIYLIDPLDVKSSRKVTHIREKASAGLLSLKKTLLE